MTNTLENNCQGSLFPTIDGIIVDCKALTSITHSCNSSNCEISNCCCSHYEVCITSVELSNIIGVMPYASQYSSLLGSDNRFINVFGDEGRNTYSIDKSHSGFCVFGYQGKHKEIVCSLHQAATDLKMSLKSLKPLECILWPLALVDSDPVILSIQEDVLSFPCNQKKNSNPIELDNGIAQIVEKAFGDSFLYQLRKIMKVVIKFEKALKTLTALRATAKEPCD